MDDDGPLYVDLEQRWQRLGNDERRALIDEARRLSAGVSPFERIGTELGRLVAEKNAAYGDSFARSGEVLRVLYPDGVRPEQYRDMLGVARVVDKLFRIAARKGAFGESPWRDIGGYGVVAAVADEGEKGAT